MLSEAGVDKDKKNNCHKFDKLPLELLLATSFWRLYNSLVASELADKGHSDCQLKRPGQYLTIEKLHYKSGWHFNGLRRLHNEINITRPKPELELLLTFLLSFSHF